MRPEVGEIPFLYKSLRKMFYPDKKAFSLRECATIRHCYQVLEEIKREGREGREREKREERERGEREGSMGREGRERC